MSTRLLSWLHCTAFPLIMAKHFVVIVVNRTDLNAQYRTLLFHYEGNNCF